MIEQIAQEEDYVFETAGYERMVMFYISGLYSATQCAGIKVDAETRRRIEALCNRAGYGLNMNRRKQHQ